jgi:hypothetical protein
VEVRDRKMIWGEVEVKRDAQKVKWASLFFIKLEHEN